MCPPPIFVMQSVPRAKSRIREIFKKSVRVVKRWSNQGTRDGNDSKVWQRRER